LFRSLFLLVFLLLSFTFLGGLEINYQMYYPITWHMLRFIITITTMYLSSYSRLMMGDCLPGPAVLVKYNSLLVGTVL
jgi:hypothetical protein